MSPTNRRTLEQEIADLQNKLARKQEAQRHLADGQKIIIGGMMLALAHQDDTSRKRLIELLEKHVTRDADLRRITPLIAELKNRTVANQTEKNTLPPSEHKRAAAASAQ